MARFKLTAQQVKGITEKGYYPDGAGLYLQVKSASSRSWLYRYAVTDEDGKSRDRWIGLGSVEAVSLSDARIAAQACREMRAKGLDPQIEKHAEADRRAVEQAEKDAATFTFRQAAEDFMGSHLPSLKNEKHKAQVRYSLEAFIYPAFGDRPLSSIRTIDVKNAIERLWIDKNETAARTLQRVRMVFDREQALGRFEGDNPASNERMKRVLPARSRVLKREHHAAMPWKNVPAFMGALAREVSIGALALRFCILTMCRTSEVLAAQWPEFDFEEGVWNIPADRMKAGKPHRVPLTPEMLAILKAAEEVKLRNNPHVFPGERKGKPMSNMAMLMIMRRFELDFTVHGFRSSARDWMAEETHYPREVCEAALAHAVGDRVEAAYRRSDLFEKRRKLMADWSKFATKKAVPLALPESAKGKTFRRSRAAAMARKGSSYGRL